MFSPIQLPSNYKHTSIDTYNTHKLILLNNLKPYLGGIRFSKIETFTRLRGHVF